MASFYPPGEPRTLRQKFPAASSTLATSTSFAKKETPVASVIVPTTKAPIVLLGRSVIELSDQIDAGDNSDKTPCLPCIFM
jgi:hypothetical protein